MPESKVLLQETQGCEHAVALGSEGSGCAALGTATAFPQNFSGRGKAPSKRSTVSGASIVGDKKRGRDGVFQENFERRWIPGSLVEGEELSFPGVELSQMGREGGGCIVIKGAIMGKEPNWNDSA
jgi:hypothetical protein